MVDTKTTPTPAPGSGPKSRRDLEASIIAKAWRDPLYKQHLLASPKVVLQHEIATLDPSVTLPPELTVYAHEETADDFHLVLPRNPKDISLAELTGDSFEALAPQTLAIVSNIVGNVVTGPVVVGNVMSGTPVVATVNVAVVAAGVQIANSTSAVAVNVIA